MQNLVKHNADAFLKTSALTQEYYSKVSQLKSCAAKNALLNELLSTANQIWQDYKIELDKKLADNLKAQDDTVRDIELQKKALETLREKRKKN